ncbi:aminopeptidase P family protein [Parasedimentitalea maritima]|uniref:M24 family metallopeptidase n=1 Tax=Parasedimentitalea maritima TaxID=2578117 RepID=A0A6A4RGW6_9RHOB|nr:aminopeptidase P family protein [Zongyanglinia marina]KAE9630060.1 M24 family metallopeptidase [Zongyanglinia marina]
MPDTSIPTAAQHIAALRTEMSTRGLDAFIIPRFDAHLGEYVAPHDERLKFVTGFSGSAGMAIVTHCTVAVFVDGRYTVQVANECPGDLFTHWHLHDAPPAQWLATNAMSEWAVGFDPMHLPTTWHDQFHQSCTNVGAKLVPQNSNPVDVIWHNQPAQPKGLISTFPLQFSGKSSADKLSDLTAHMVKAGADFFVETQPDNIAWLMNVRGEDLTYTPVPHSFLLVAQSGQVFWSVDQSKFDDLVHDSLPEKVAILPQGDFLKSILERVGVGKAVLLDPGFSPIAVRLALADVQAVEVNETSSLTLAKAKKNATELEGIRACHVQDGVALTEFCAWISKAVPMLSATGSPLRERDAEEKILALRKARPGFICESFDTISAASGNAAMCHYSTTPEQNAPILPENPYLLDSGGQYDTGTTDVTRSFCFGAASEEYRRAYTAVFKAFHALATLRFPKGTQGHHIDAICRRPLWDLGLDYDHGTGHGIGHCLSVHEHPHRIGKDVNPVDLVPGMVLSIEPGFYAADQFGIRIENLFEIVEEADGFLSFQNLTFAPIQTDMLNLSSLSPSELDWLNTYHEEVVSRLSPFLTEATRDWLVSVCSALALSEAH